MQHGESPVLWGLCIADVTYSGSKLLNVSYSSSSIYPGMSDEEDVVSPRPRIFSWIVIFILSLLLYGMLLYEEIEMDKAWANVSQIGAVNSYINLLSMSGIVGDDASQSVSNILNMFSEDTFDEHNSPGFILKEKGVSAHFPVLMVPGVISTSLELWEGLPCSRKFFRQRFWGTLSMLRIMLVDKYCWMKHMQLDPTTGTDPPGIKLRAAQGIEAADFLLPGFWVWARIIENLALLGYDHSNMMMAPYDWRIDFDSMEKRDHYFSRMKSNIEYLYGSKQRKVVILCHSLGAMAWLYFMKWVEADPTNTGGIGGGGGAKWIDKHIESYVNIAGPLLGVPKSISCIISGEMRDTAQMGKLETYILESMLSKKERLGMFRTWSGPMSMFPKGGNLVWDSLLKNKTLGMINILGEDSTNIFRERLGFDDVKYIAETFLPPALHRRLKSVLSTDIAKVEDIPLNNQNPTKWSNPLEFSLPDAPNMKVYCFYGVKRQTELGYFYKTQKSELLNSTESERINSADPSILTVPIIIDSSANDVDSDLSNGIVHSDGDGTVPLISLGFMCRKGWREMPHLNPANVSVVTKEFEHEPSLVDLRGGPKTGDHVDILGNHELLMDIMKISSNYMFIDGGTHFLPQDRIFSEIDNISEGVAKKIREFTRQQEYSV